MKIIKSITAFIITITCSIIFLYFVLLENNYLIATDLAATMNIDDCAENPYLEMVVNHKPFNDGETYIEAFSRNFDSNHWTYFKTENGQRIVQVVSGYNDIPGEKMITQISVTPVDNNRGYFYIEPYAMQVSGHNLTENEMNIVLAAVFKNDIVNALEELFFYSLLY